MSIVLNILNWLDRLFAHRGQPVIVDAVVPYQPAEPIPSIVRRQGAALSQHEREQFSEWLLADVLGEPVSRDEAAWWEQELRHTGEPVA